ncbi:hypothetical protein GIB67_007930 [Kingdonia uniflora]|uniref:Uncharacterized protein n=1 Tax=Kingdonia uniflora TaxID=39325 RepID=A0A7J7NLX5_9MAGN|nr:hypothetical protein GIB67_007930 [Kingdonia uniflora]
MMQRADQEIMYSQVLSSVLTSMQVCCKDIKQRNINLKRGNGVEDSTGSRVDYFIKLSVRMHFPDVEIGGNSKIVEAEDEKASKGLLRLAKETVELAMKEKETFSPILNRWHLIAVRVAAMTLHNVMDRVEKILNWDFHTIK